MTVPARFGYVLGWPDFITAGSGDRVNPRDYRVFDKHGPRLPRDMQFDEFPQVRSLHRLPHRITLECKHVLGILRRIRQCPLPQSVLIGRLVSALDGFLR